MKRGQLAILVFAALAVALIAFAGGGGDDGGKGGGGGGSSGDAPAKAPAGRCGSRSPTRPRRSRC